MFLILQVDLLEAQHVAKDIQVVFELLVRCVAIRCYLSHLFMCIVTTPRSNVPLLAMFLYCKLSPFLCHLTFDLDLSSPL